MGNHDYGRADYICSDGDRARKCASVDDLLVSLKDKFAWQATYTSPNEARSVLKDHFYVYTIRNKFLNVCIGIFDVDSGDADAHGAKETCCQCYGYAGGNDKKGISVARGYGGDVDIFKSVWLNSQRGVMTRVKNGRLALPI